jgi:hypothetical protein
MPIVDPDVSYRILGNALAGGNSGEAAYREAQGEMLGANTQSAIAEANLRNQKLNARNSMGTSLAALYPDHPEVSTALGAAAQAEIPFEQVTTSRLGDQQFNNRATIADTSKPLEQRVAAGQAIYPNGIANPQTDAQQQLAIARAADANSHVPVNQSQVGLNNSKAGYYDRSPGIGMGGANALGDLSPQLTEAVSSGRLNPARLNSRTVRIYDQLAQHDPTLDFNAANAGAVAQSNMTFRQRDQVIQALPTNIANMVNLGSKVNYSDAKFAGEAQKWLLGQSNDPALTEYMGVRNDVLLNLANVMRGVGMSDQAHKAEIEAASPTLTPAALQAWAHGQYQVIATRQQQNRQLMHPDIHGGAPAPPGAAPAAPGAAPAAPGGVPQGSAPGIAHPAVQAAAPPGAKPGVDFATEADAEKAAAMGIIKSGDKITVGGHGGTWQ